MARQRWGQGTVRQEASGSWGYRVPDGKGRRIYKGGFATRDLAERARRVVAGIVAFDRAGVMPDTKALPRLGELRVPYLAARERTHVAGVQDKQRWDGHMKSLDPLRPGDVTVAVLRQWVRECRTRGLSGSSIKVMLSTLSGLFVELQERGLVQANPTKGLPPSVRAMLRDDTDPTSRPFIERLEDVRRVLIALDEPFAALFALGVYAGLRPGEARGLEWASVDMDRWVIHVRQQAARSRQVRLPKGGKVRFVPILAELRPILAVARIRTGGTGLVAPPLRRWRGTLHVCRGSANEALESILARLGISRDGLDYYGATRHTFASHYMLRGGNLKRLSLVLGHASQSITEKHYLHLAADKFVEDDSAILGAGHSPPTGEVLPLPVQALRKPIARRRARRA
jgi:integrase